MAGGVACLIQALWPLYSRHSPLSAFMPMLPIDVRVVTLLPPLVACVWRLSASVPYQLLAGFKSPDAMVCTEPASAVHATAEIISVLVCKHSRAQSVLCHYHVIGSRVDIAERGGGKGGA